MQNADELLLVADALFERARRFSSGAGYEAGVSETLEAVASLVRVLAHTPYESIDLPMETGAAAGELRRIAAQFEIATIHIEHLTRLVQRWSERAAVQVDLQPLDSAARALKHAVSRLNAAAGETAGPTGRPRAVNARHEINYVAALALGLTRAEPAASDRLVQQLRDAANHRSELLAEAAARLAQEHDTTDGAANRAIQMLERAADLPVTP